MKKYLYKFLNIGLGIAGSLLGVFGHVGEYIFKKIKFLGIAIVEYSFKLDGL